MDLADLLNSMQPFAEIAKGMVKPEARNTVVIHADAYLQGNLEPLPAVYFGDAWLVRSQEGWQIASEGGILDATFGTFEDAARCMHHASNILQEG